MLLCIATAVAPAAFATLPPADAGRFVARVLKLEAYASLAVALILLMLERLRSRKGAASGFGSVLGANFLLLMGTLFCTVTGHFAVQPMMAAARIGQGAYSFGALHAVSGGLFALKGLLVLALAWRFCER